MTNDPANITALLRALITWGICALLAIIIGVLMTNPLTYSSLGFVGAVCAVLFLPILLRWHHPLMIFLWNAPITVFFLKGDPKLCLVMIAISFTISITERTLGEKRFIKVPSITWSLIALIGVVLITAKLTGGFGLKSFGSDVYGGKKYVFLIVAILGYFALTSRPIPVGKAKTYVTLYFLFAAMSFIGDFYQLMPHALMPIFWLIPPTVYDPNGFSLGSTRLVNTAWAATAVVSALIARYGLRGIFLEGKLWRSAVFFIFIALIFLGGFRSALVLTGALVMLQFFLEGLHRTKLLPVFVLIGLACAAMAIPFASKLPFTFQRTLAFLPRDWIHLSTAARMDAQGSIDWRVDMWKGLLPQIPKHLLLGKGYAITMEDYAAMGQDSAIRSTDTGQQSLALSSDYHNGPLSVILPFGIWGALLFLWFLGASLRITYLNYQYGRPDLQTINTFLFATYVVAVINFLFLFGSLADGMAGFAGLLGLSICINHGVCRAPARPSHSIPVNLRFAKARAKLQPAFQNGDANPRSL
jgi:hypothetical protein